MHHKMKSLCHCFFLSWLICYQTLAQEVRLPELPMLGSGGKFTPYQVRIDESPNDIRGLSGWFQRPANSVDNSSAWHTAFAGLENYFYSDSVAELPLIDMANQTPWSDSLSDRSRARVLAFLNEHDDRLQVAYSALSSSQPDESMTARPGFDAANMDMSDVNAASIMTRLLLLHARMAHADGADPQSVLSALRIAARSASAMHGTPGIGCVTARLGASATVLRQVCEVVGSANWDDAQLSQLTRECLLLRPRAATLEAYIGERALLLEGFEDPGKTFDMVVEAQTYMLGERPFKPETERKMKAYILQHRQQDRSVLDQTMQRAIRTMRRAQQSKLPSIMTLKALKDIDSWHENDLLQQYGQQAHLSNLTLPSFATYFVNEIRVQLWHDATIVAIAVRRYQLENQRLPARLDELVPKYLPRLPIDPWSGAPLKADLGNTNLRIQSTGPQNSLGLRRDELQPTLQPMEINYTAVTR